MAQTRDESPPSRIELVVLGCLSQPKPPSDAELGDALRELAAPLDPPEATRARAVELLATAVRRGWVGTDRKLTDNGKRVLRETFELARTPSWTQVRDKHLPSRALGLTPSSELARATQTETAMMAAVLGARFNIRDARTPVAVCDALIARALGLPPGKLTLDRMRAHVLAGGFDVKAPGAPSPSAKGYAPKLAAWIACNAVGASEPPRKKMARALARNWVRQEPNVLGAAPASAAGTIAVAAAPNVVAPQQGTPPTVTPPIVTPAAVTTPAVAAPITAAPITTVPITTASITTAPVAPPASPPSIKASNSKPTSTKSTTSSPSAGQPAERAPDLLAAVRDTIPRIGNEGRFGEKVYVSAIWRTITRDRKAADLSLDHFKRWLLGANRDGWLVLARADLIGAMDAKQVTESEINDRGATFHFVLDQRNGASRSSRENHAG